MTRYGRVAATMLALLAIIVSAILPALAQEEETGDSTTSTSTTLEQVIPAVTVPPDVEEPVVPDWTYRYMIPTGLALAAVVILLTSIRYFTNVVRKRYRIVEE